MFLVGAEQCTWMSQGRVTSENFILWGTKQKHYFTFTKYLIQSPVNLAVYHSTFGSLVTIRIPLILNIHEFHIGKFAYSLNLFVNSKIITRGTFASIHRHVQRSKENLNDSMHTFPAEVEPGRAPVFRVGSPTVNKCPFSQWIERHLFCIFVLFCAFSWCFRHLRRPPAHCWNAVYWSQAWEIGDEPHRENTCAGEVFFRRELWCCRPRVQC